MDFIRHLMHTLTLAGQLRSEKGEHVGSLQRLMISAGAGHGRIRPKPILFHTYTLTGRDNMRFGAWTSGRINKNPPATEPLQPSRCFDCAIDRAIEQQQE